MTLAQAKLSAMLTHVATGHGLDCADSQALIDELHRSHEFIREVAWRFSEHASANWSGPDVVAHVADFFGVTVRELDEAMRRVA